MVRLFIGTFVAKEDQDRLAPLPQQNPHLDALWQRKVRWVKPEKLHMTWLFLGEVDETLVDRISKSMTRLIDKADLPTGAFSINFDKPETWPSTRKPRQVVVTPQAFPESVKSLSRVIRLGLLEYYTEQAEREQNRAFRPHITVLRVDRRNVKEEEKRSVYKSVEKKVDPSEIRSLSDSLPIILNVDRVCLIRSHLSGESDSYEILHSYSLNQGSKAR